MEYKKESKNKEERNNSKIRMNYQNRNIALLYSYIVKFGRKYKNQYNRSRKFCCSS